MLLDIASPVCATALKAMLQLVLGLHAGENLLPVAMAYALLPLQAELTSSLLGPQIDGGTLAGRGEVQRVRVCSRPTHFLPV